MITQTLKEIESAKSKLAALEKKAASELAKQLTNLHKDLGYATRGDLIAALQGLEKGKSKRGRKPKKTAAKKRVAKKAARAKKRAKRTAITDELRKKVIAAVKSGAKGAAIAKQFGISIPSIQNIKKAAGLTKPRK